MKKKFFSFVLAIFLILPCIIGLSGCNGKEKYTLQNINNEAYENMPIVEINTQNKVLPYNKEDYINCSFKISNCDNDEYNFEVEMKDKYGEEDSVGIRLRGNSTRNMPKKP